MSKPVFVPDDPNADPAVVNAINELVTASYDIGHADGFFAGVGVTVGLVIAGVIGRCIARWVQDQGVLY